MTDQDFVLLNPKPKEGWLPTKALVYSVEWIDPSRNDFGHYSVVYSYRANDELYTGKFNDYGPESETYLHPKDVIDIQYNPEHLEDSYYPLVRTATKRRVLSFAIGLAIGIAVLLIVYINNGFK